VKNFDSHKSAALSKQRGRSRFKIYPGNRPCPCGSNIVYQKCCKHKKFRFEIDKHGNIRKSLKIHPNLKPALDEALERFRDMFGRRPRGSDPILFEHYLSGEDDFWQTTQAAFRNAGTPDELFFAYRRSGFLVGGHSRDLMPDSEHQEWTDAINEYFELKALGHDPFYIFTYLNGPEYENYKSLIKLIDSTIIALGFAYTNPKKFQSTASYFRYLLLCRAVRSLRTIREMYNARYDDDCLAIARAVYETYLRMKLLRLDPSSSHRFEAMAAHAAGQFPSKLKKNGQPYRWICVNPQTGEEFDINVSNQAIIDISDFSLDSQLYSELYPLLSGFVHPEFVGELLKATTDEPYKNDPIRAITLITSICLLLIQEVIMSSFLKALTRRDLTHVLKKLRTSLSGFITTETIMRRQNVPSSIYDLVVANRPFQHRSR